VFGASWCKPGDALYLESERCGAAVAAAGFALVNGGYCGTMEGSAKGAASVGAGTEVEGVLVSTLFRSRPGGNAFLTRSTTTATLLDRIQVLVARSDYFIVLRGTLGTLTELCLAWNVAALGREGGYRAPKIYCYRDPWEPVLTAAIDGLGIPAEIAAQVTYVVDAAEAVRLISADYAAIAEPRGP